MRVDPLELALAPDLLDLVDTARGGDLLDRVHAAAPQGRAGHRPRHPAGAHPRRPDLPAPVRHPGSTVSRPARGHSPPARSWPSVTAWPAYPAGRPGSRCSAWRKVGARRAAAAGRDGRAPPSSTGPGSSPRTWPRWSGRNASASAGPGGRQGAGGDGPSLAPGRRRRAHPGAAQPRRGPAGAARAAGRGGLDPRPGPHLRGAVAAGEEVHGPRRPGRGGPRGAGWRDQPAVRDAGRAAARDHAGPGVRAAPARGGPPQRPRPGPGARQRRRRPRPGLHRAAGPRRPDEPLPRARLLPAGASCPTRWSARSCPGCRSSPTTRCPVPLRSSPWEW